MMKGNPIEILLVEDNPGDVRLVREVFKDAKVANKIHVVEDGVEAIDFLRNQGRFADAVRPDLVLLDLNLPKKDGREVLTEIKTDDALKHIPVIVLTTSSAEEDIMKSYSAYANSYITKPLSLSQLIEVLRSIEDFWLTIVQLPSNGKL